MSTINLWSFSPLSGPLSRERGFQDELPGGENRVLPGSGGLRRRGSVGQLLRLLRILARRRRQSGGR